MSLVVSLALDVTSCENTMILFYYIDTDKMPGFFFYKKVISSASVVKILFLSFTCEDIGVAMVTNMIGSSFPLRLATGSF